MRAVPTRLVCFVIACTILGATGTGAAAGEAGRTATNGGTATYAQQPGVSPNYIFPLQPLTYYGINNTVQFQYLFYRPLYWFGVGSRPILNEQLSLAYLPQYSDGGRSVTITLKHYRWSDGLPVTSRDVQFWMNLLKANKANWGGYVPGDFPDNVRGFHIDSPSRFTMTLRAAYGSYWFTDDELSQITPIPQQTWDKVSSSSPDANYDFSNRGAVRVYAYLSDQAKSLSTYATNPIWKVIDGPWRLASYVPSTGYAAFVPNPQYSGPIRPRLSRFIEVPFTSDTAEFDALRGGQIDYGYLPIPDISQASFFKGKGYRVVPWILWQISDFGTNFTNPKIGPVLSQLYVRQAMQTLIDQPADVRDIYKGYAYPDYGPVPTEPPSPYTTPLERSGAYPYSPAKARTLLRSHGWTVRRNGVTTCARPGSGRGDCGAGVPRGRAMDFPLEYNTGDVAVAELMQSIKSSFSLAGINIELQPAPLNVAVAGAFPCNKKTGAGCSWAFNQSGYWHFGPYPDGGPLFACGAGSNEGDYCNATNDANIGRTHTGSGLQPLYKYENFAVRNLPELFIPVPVNAISVIANRLHGTLPQNPFDGILPENWHLAS